MFISLPNLFFSLALLSPCLVVFIWFKTVLRFTESVPCMPDKKVFQEKLIAESHTEQ